MSLWYQAPVANFPPQDSRSIGWSQVPNRKAALSSETPEDSNPQSSTGGGTLLDLGSSFNIRGPQTQLGFDLTANYANYQFQNVNDLTFNQQQFQNNVNATLNDITNNLSVVSSNNFEGRIAALEAWRATGIDYNCDTGNTLIVMKDWEFDDVNNKIINTYRSITIVDGLVTSQNCGLPDGETPVTSCPP